MDFLGLYNLLMALAVAGACGGAYNCDDVDYSPGPSYVADRATPSLPPAWSIINRPPTMVDNGYNPGFYWNRPRPEDGDDYADAGYDYRPYPAYGVGYAGSGYVASDRYYGGYDGGYYDSGQRGDANGGNRPHRHRRAAHVERVQAVDPGDRDAAPRHVDRRAGGYNGHDRHMFDRERRAANAPDGSSTD